MQRNDVTPASEHTPEPGRDLLERFHRGDAEAIDALATLFFDDVMRFSRSMVADEDAAMDAVQETFLRLLERHRLFDPARAFRPWLFAVCRNTCLTLRRQRAGQVAKVIALDEDGEEAQRLAADVPPAFEAMIRREREAEALAMLATLPEQTREVILLHLFEGLPFREIAEITGRPAATAATTYYRALADIRKRMEAREGADAGRNRRHAL